MAEKRIRLISVIRVISFSLLVYLLSSLALFYGFFHTPKDMVFLGGHLPDSGEILNMVLPQLKQGNFLIKNLYTSEFQPRIFLASSYFPIAFLTKMLPFGDFAATNIVRLIYTIIFFFTVNKFLKLFFKEKEIWRAMFILAFSSGFGFFLKFFISTSIDLWIPEANVFHTILYSTNFIFNQTLFVLSFYFLIKHLSLPSTSSGNKVLNSEILFSSLCLTLVSFEHQFDVVTFFAAVFLYLFYTGKNIKMLLGKIAQLWLYLIPLGSLLLQAFLVYHFPNVLAWTKQTHLQSPPILSYLSGFGLMGIFAIIFLFKNDLAKLPVSYKIIIFWIAAVVLLIYSPIAFQRRFSEGVFIPLVVLAGKPLFLFLAKARGKGFFFLLLFSCSVFLLYQDIKAFRIDFSRSPFYIYKKDIKGLKWLEEKTTDKDVILADAIYSPLIPGLIGRSVYFGHQVGTVLTINPQQKSDHVKNFFFKDTDAEREKFLIDNHITYFFLGKKDEETEDFKSWEGKKYLRVVYQDDGVKIFNLNTN